MERVNQILEQYLWNIINYHQNNCSDLLFVAEFSYNNMMHSTTQQTPLFTNHGLHPKFDIQGVNDVMNSIAKDWVMWLINIWTQLISNLEEAWRQYKENANKHCKDQPNFKFGDQAWFQRQNIKTIWLLEKLDYQRFGPFTIVKHINTMAFQLKFP